MNYLSREASHRIVAQELDDSCGAACARQLLLDRGIDVPESTLRDDAFYGPKGIYADKLAGALTKHATDEFFGGVADLEEEAQPRLVHACAPVIVMLDSHWVIADHIGADAVDVRDPHRSGEEFGFACRIGRKEFVVAWQRGDWQAVWRRR